MEIAAKNVVKSRQATHTKNGAKLLGKLVRRILSCG